MMIMSKAKTDGIKLIANNKKARHDYFVEDSFEAGIVLHGTEVKIFKTRTLQHQRILC